MLSVQCRPLHSGERLHDRGSRLYGEGGDPRGSGIGIEALRGCPSEDCGRGVYRSEQRGTDGEGALIMPLLIPLREFRAIRGLAGIDTRPVASPGNRYP